VACNERERDFIIEVCRLITRISHATWGSEAYPISESDEKFMAEIAKVCDRFSETPVPHPVAGEGGAPPSGLRAEPGRSCGTCDNWTTRTDLQDIAVRVFCPIRFSPTHRNDVCEGWEPRSEKPPLDHKGAEECFGFGSYRYPELIYEAFFSGVIPKGYVLFFHPAPDSVWIWHGDGRSE